MKQKEKREEIVRKGESNERGRKRKGKNSRERWK